MSDPSIPVVDVRDWFGDDEARARFVRGVGESLADIGFFALANHGISPEDTQRAYATAREFFALPPATKAAYHRAGAKGQRGYTGFGTEHAKDAQAADLKEFWQVGRVDVPDGHEVHQPFGPNLWPDADVPAFRPVMSELYRGLDRLGAALRRGVDSRERRVVIEVAIGQLADDRGQSGRGLPDVDHQAVAVQGGRPEGGVHDIGRPVQPLGRPKNRTREAVGNHHVVADGDAEHVLTLRHTL